jgi:hypothetical protein
VASHENAYLQSYGPTCCLAGQLQLGESTVFRRRLALSLVNDTLRPLLLNPPLEAADLDHNLVSESSLRYGVHTHSGHAYKGVFHLGSVGPHHTATAFLSAVHPSLVARHTYSEDSNVV